MSIQHLPYAPHSEQEVDATIKLVDYQFRERPNNQMIKLNSHIISLVVSGSTHVRIKHKETCIDSMHVAFLRKGNCIMQESGSSGRNFRSLILSFTDLEIERFLEKNFSSYKCMKLSDKTSPFFKVKKDRFIKNTIESLETLMQQGAYVMPKMLDLKLEEVLMYMCEKEGESFLTFLCSLVNPAKEVSLEAIVDNNTYTNLNLNELSFLCEVSLSSFKRHFSLKYGVTPGKYFQKKRLNRAKQLMETGEARAVEVYQLFGYENISNFSAAFKNTFGYPPKDSYVKVKEMILG